MKTGEHNKNAALLFWLLSLVFSSALLFASPEQADEAEEKARASFIEHFTTFVQDKNVMGRATTPDGKPSAPGPAKTQFNRDDGMSYKSDLTYHDFAYTTDDQSYAKKQEANAGKNANGKNEPSSRRLRPFTSSHGGLSEAGGSSQLERKMYELHDKFSKEENDPDKQKKDDEELGIKYRSAFKIETREVFKKDDPSKNASSSSGAAAGGAGGALAAAGAGGAAGGANANKKDEEAEKVERVILRDEAKPEIEKVGEDSFKSSIERSARDKGFEDDEKTLDNGTLLREAAGRATQSWWDSTLANLNQRRVNKGVDVGGSFGSSGGPKLDEDTPTCEDWAKKELQERQNALAKATNGKVDPKQVQEFQKEIDQAKQKCEQLTKLNYNAINPRFEAKENGKGEELKTGDLNKEDPYSRDLRNQLEVLQSAGKSVNNLETNWKYDEKEEKQKITISFDEEGNPSEVADWTVRDQLESYNEQIEEAAKGFKDIKERWPDLKINEQDITKFKIDPETRSTMEINQMTPSMKEDFGVKVDPEKGEAPPPQNYEELLEKSKGPSSR